MTFVEDLFRVCNAIEKCQDCHLHAECTKKVYDHPLMMYANGPIPVVFVGMSPAYCEDRTGLPLVGAEELMVSRCGWCSNLAKCYGYFLNIVEAYKTAEEPCPYAKTVERCDQVQRESVQKRITAIPRDMRKSVRTAGEILNGMLRECKLVRSTRSEYLMLSGENYNEPNCAFINTVQCRTTTVDSSGNTQNRPPTDDERLCCAKHVHAFIELLQPQCIVALGNDALKTVTELKNPKVSQLLDTTLDYAGGNIPVYALYHPAFHMRSQNSAPGIAADTERLRQIVARHLPDRESQ